jgi:hypothetical protein
MSGEANSYNLNKRYKKNKKIFVGEEMLQMSGGELLEMRLLDSHLLDTFGSKSIARHEIDKLLESSKSWLNWIRAVDKKSVICSTVKKCHLLDTVEQMTLSRATYKLKKSIFFL